MRRGRCGAFLAEQRGVKPRDVAEALYDRRGPAAIRHVFRSRARSTRSSSARRRSSASSRRRTASPARRARRAACSAAASSARSASPSACAPRRRSRAARRTCRRWRSSSRRACSATSTGKSVLVVGAGKMSTLAARHLYASGAQQIVVTNRSPEKAEALAAEIEGIAKPWDAARALLVEADVVISSTGAREPILTRALFKKVTKARRWRPMIVIDIAVPRDAEPAIGELDGVYLFDIDDLDKVVAGEPRRAREGGRARRARSSSTRPGSSSSGCARRAWCRRSARCASNSRRSPTPRCSKALDQLGAQGPDARRSSASCSSGSCSSSSTSCCTSRRRRCAAPTRRGQRCAAAVLCELFGARADRRARRERGCRSRAVAAEQAPERKAQA